MTEQSRNSKPSSQPASSSTERTSLSGVLKQHVPIVRWLPRYQRAWLGADLIAGATIWGLLIPEMIAYAGLAGLSPQAGLYTLLAALGLYAIFGTSRQLVVAGTSASAVLVFSAVTAVGTHDAHHYAVVASGFIVITGIIFVVAGLLKLGFITAFLSKPVMAGFIFGLAIFVTVSQLPKLFGLEKGDGDTVRQFAHVVKNLGNASVVTLVVGVAALALLFGLERYIPRVPGGLVVLAAGIAISAAFDLSSHGVATVGKIPSGLPTIVSEHITVSELWVLLPSAVGMMLVIFSEALGAGETFAEKHGYRLDTNQEMIALGLANIGSGFLGGLACGGSLSQTAVNDGAGARSEMSAIVAAVLSLITVIALTPLFKDLPEAVLAALIIHAVSHLMKVGEMRRFYQLVPREFWLGMLTLGGVIVLDVLPGLIIGVVVSLLLVFYRSSRLGLSVLGADPAVARGLPRRPAPLRSPADSGRAGSPARRADVLRQFPIHPRQRRIACGLLRRASPNRHPGSRRQRRARHHQHREPRQVGRALRRPARQNRLRPFARPGPRDGPPNRNRRPAWTRPDFPDPRGGHDLGAIDRS